MLQTHAVHTSTLGLLKELMLFEPLAAFNLVGGTALALQYGHRISIDLDFFSTEKFNVDQLKFSIQEFCNNKSLVWKTETNAALIGEIDGIKIDIIHYPYPLIDDLILQENIRMLSPKDIGAMKLSAIAQRGSKKDFFDFYELLDHHSLEEMLSFFMKKFPNTDTAFILRSLTYFEDGEIQKDPIMLNSSSWNEVKKRITNEVRAYVEM